jgi:hypothetical protein
MMNCEIRTISGISPLAKSAQILDSAIARTIVRLVSGCYFGYVFYFRYDIDLLVCDLLV